MSKHFWFGEQLDDIELDDRVINYSQWVTKKRASLTPERLISTLHHWALNLELDINSSFKEELISFCNKESLKRKVVKELGGLDRLSFRRVGFDGNFFEKRAPLGIVAHVLPGNSEGLSILAAIESLLVGNINIIKLSSEESDLAIDLAQSLSAYDKSGYIRERLAFVRLSSSSKTLEHLFKVSDGVSAWGGDAALTSIRSKLSAQTVFIPWGHKVSFSLVSSEKISEENLKKMAHDIIDLDQQACSSPQVILFECDNSSELRAFGELIMPYLVEASKEKGALSLSVSQRAELQNQALMYKFMESQEEGFLLEDSDVRVFGRMKSELCPSPLNRSIHLRPIQKERISEVLLPWREYLQSCGLSCSSKDEFLAWSEQLINAGVLRVCLPGKIVESYAGEPHDGQFALSRFSKVVRIEIPDAEKLSTPFIEAIEKKGAVSPIMRKEGFQNQKDNGLAKLYFKSGGSSGSPKISRFSYEDYNSQMQAAADGLLAGGLEPLNDRVINLFFGGGLYGGFLSFTTILEKLDCVQLPMGAVEDFEFITSQIISLKVNTLMGMPSFLFQYLQDQKEELAHYGGLQKIFYGGEHFSTGQKRWIEEALSVSFIKSASYGSVDAGPIGHQCLESSGGIHHLNYGLQKLEIFKIDEDCPVEKAEEVGRLIVSTPEREAMLVENYEIGDLGRWIEGNCPCGSPAPRFELLGRMGDIFRAAGNFLNYRKFERVLVEEGFSGEFQLLIENNEDRDSLTLVLGKESEPSISIDRLSIVNHIKELREAVVDDGTLDFKVSYREIAELERTPGSGKLRHVVDRRKY